MSWRRDNVETRSPWKYNTSLGDATSRVLLQPQLSPALSMPEPSAEWSEHVPTGLELVLTSPMSSS